MKRSKNTIIQKRRTRLFFAILIIALIIFAAFKYEDIYRKWVYPIKYENYVEKYSEEYGVDKYLIYAIINTESGFDSDAQSNVGARGLMQLMDNAYDWVKYRMGDERELTYDDMYNAEYNVQYGTYLLKLLYDEYGSYNETIAAYHAGRGAVNGWLENKEYSNDGEVLDKIPSRDTNHYVSKVMKAYEAYINLY